MVFEKPKLSEIILSSGSFGFYFLCYGYLSLRYAFIRQPARSMSRAPRVTPGSDSVTGRRVPPGEVVVRMMDLYNCQYLAVSHLRTSEACASFLPDVKLQDLPTAILRLQKELNDFLKCREEVLDITCDGVISPEERPRWEKVLKELDDVSAAIMAVKFAD